MLKTGDLVASGGCRMELTSFKASFPENCHHLTCLVVPCKTVLLRLYLFNMTQSGGDLLGKAFFSSGVFAKTVSVSRLT